MESGPTYLLIMAISVVGVLGSFVIFLDSDNQNVALLLQTILSLASLAYATVLKVENDKQKEIIANGKTTDQVNKSSA